MLHIIVLFIVVFFVNVYCIYGHLELENKVSNRLLLLIFLIVLFQIFIGIFIRFIFPNYINLFLAFPFSLIFGPAAMAFLNFKNSNRLPANYYLHFVPFFLAVCCLIFFNWNPRLSYLYYDSIFIICSILSAFIYLSYLLWFVKRLNNKRQFRCFGLLFISKKHVAFALITLIIIFSFLIFKIEGGDLNVYEFLKLISLLLFFCTLSQFPALKAIYKTNTTKESLDHVKKSELELESISAVQKTAIALPVEVEYLYRQKIEFFIRSKGFLDIDLNREQFCEQLDIKKNYLGPFLKKCYKRNFNGFINQLRLHYANQLLLQEELQYTIEDLSFVCGFNSRASFYRNFISEYGCPPHKYRTKIQGELKKTLV